MELLKEKYKYPTQLYLHAVLGEKLVNFHHVV